MASQHVEVMCPRCREPFEIDPNRGSLPYDCPHCSEPASLSVLLNPNLDPKNAVINKVVLDGDARNAFRCTVGYTSKQSGEINVASGVMVQIEGTFLVATTAHSIPLKLDRVNFAPKTDSGSLERKPQIVRFAKAEGVDVGLIEIEPEGPALIGTECLPLERIADLGCGRPGDMSCLLGYSTKPAADGSPRIFPYFIQGEPLAPRFWDGVEPSLGTIDDAGGLSLDTHALIYFARKDLEHTDTGEPATDDTSNYPFGQSGGGHWLRNAITSPTQLWSPDSLHLFAIQSSWPKRGTFLKAIQIIHWLRLVADTYPNLRPMLGRRFPRL